MAVGVSIGVVLRAVAVLSLLMVSCAHEKSALQTPAMAENPSATVPAAQSDTQEKAQPAPKQAVKTVPSSVATPAISYDYGASSIRTEQYRSVHLLSRATVSSQQADLVEMVFASIDGRTRLLLRHDPQLDVVAGVAAQFKAERRADPSREVLQALMTRAGSTAQLLDGYVHFVESPIAEQELAGRWITDSGRIKNADTAMSFGVARVRLGEMGMAQAVVLGEERVLIEAISKQQGSGGNLAVTGRMPPMFTSARFYLDFGGSEVRSHAVDTAVDGSFSVQIPLPEKAGQYNLEMNGLYNPDSAQGSGAYVKQQLLLPLYIGQSEPVSLPSWIVHQYPNPRDAKQWQSAYVNIYNEERLALGLSPLRLGGQLGPLAHRHSKIILHRGGLPTNREVTKELGGRGVPVERLHRWHGKTTNVLTAAKANLESPSHRTAILSPEITEIGVGFAPDGYGGIRYVEYLMSVIEIQVGDGAGAESVQLLNQSRLAAGLPGYVHMLEAQAAVQAFADEVCRGERTEQQVDGIWPRLRASGVRYARGRHYWSTSSKPMDSAFVEAKRQKIIATPYTHVAVGTCQGELNGIPNRHYQLFVFLSLKP